MPEAIAPFWHRFDICRIEDLGNVVLGAGLEAIQMSGPPVRGSLAFAARDGIIFSSGHLMSRVMISGPLSPDALTLVIGLRYGSGSRLWLNSVNEGDVGILLPGDELDALFTSGSLYFAATLSAERLEEEASREGIALEGAMVLRTGLHERPIAPPSLAWLSSQVADIHAHGAVEAGRDRDVGCGLLRAALEHCSRLPAHGNGRTQPVGRARIVHPAREYIRENLAAPVKLDDIAEAAETSRRSLSRAFIEILGDTPGRYVRRLRLHRIRRELAPGADGAYPIAAISARCGIREPGRMSGWYRELFGETPRTTQAVHLARLQQSVWF